MRLYIKNEIEESLRAYTSCGMFEEAYTLCKVSNNQMLPVVCLTYAEELFAS